MVLTAEAHLPETEGSGTAVRGVLRDARSENRYLWGFAKALLGRDRQFSLDVTPRAGTGSTRWTRMAMGARVIVSG